MRSRVISRIESGVYRSGVQSARMSSLHCKYGGRGVRAPWGEIAQLQEKHHEDERFLPGAAEGGGDPTRSQGVALSARASSVSNTLGPSSIIQLSS